MSKSNNKEHLLLIRSQKCGSPDLGTSVMWQAMKRSKMLECEFNADMPIEFGDGLTDDCLLNLVMLFVSLLTVFTLKSLLNW